MSPVWAHQSPRVPELRVFPVEFGGLNLRDDAQSVGWSGAVDMLNCDLDERGIVRSRDGFARLGSSTISGTDSTTPTAIPYTSSLLAVASTITTQAYLDTVSTTGTVSAKGNWATASGGTASMTRLGTATSSLLFIAYDNTTLRKYDGSSVASSVGQPAFVAVSPMSNRLVQAYFNSAGDSPTGANGSTSTVFFSDPGAPETFSANNYVHLDPGDSETIVAMVAWRDLLFVFKRSHMYVFYGEGTDSTGEPVFDYRKVSLGGPNGPVGGAGNQRSVVAGEDAVYYTGENGLYRTEGGPPDLISGIVRPIMHNDPGGTPSAARTPYLSTRNLAEYLSYANGRLYAASGIGTASYLVYDIRGDYWLLWDLAGSTTAPLVALDGQLYQINSGQQIWRQAIDTACERASNYRLGFSDLGTPGTEKILRELILDGVGTVTVKVAVNDSATLDAGAAVTLGTSPATAQGRHRKSYRGRNVSVDLSGSASASWRVRRMVGHVLGERQPGLKSA